MAGSSRTPDRSARNRGTTKFDRRAVRNKRIIIVMAVLMGLSLVAVPLGLAISSGSSSAPEPEDDPFAAPEEPAEPEVTVGPCGPTPDEVPEVTSVIYDAPFPITIDTDARHVATLVTTCGDIVVELATDAAPIAVNNLVNLAEDGYFDGVIFHRVTDGPPVIQGGDPAGTGCGRQDCTAAGLDDPSFPGYTIEDELEGAEEMGERLARDLLPQLRAELDELLDAGVDPEDLGLPAEPTDDDLLELVPGGYARGTLAMANAGPDTAGSQFFIVWEDTPLPPLYTVVGQVIEGMDVVDAIAASPTQVASATPERPYEPTVIRSVTIAVE